MSKKNLMDVIDVGFPIDPDRGCDCSSYGLPLLHCGSGITPELEDNKKI